MVDYPLMVEIVGDMAVMARRGEAAAVLARGLPGSLEGQLVAAWLREAVAVPEGAGRDRAALMLRQAAGWYLAENPGDAAALETMLGLIGVPGGLEAASLPGAVPELPPGRWAEAAGSYEMAYGAVREAARGVALPPAAVRALVGELAGLAPGRDVVGYLPGVLGDQDVLRLLGGIGQGLPGRGGAELMAAVNDLLVAASVGVAAGDGVRAGGLVSAGRLAGLLGEIGGALAEGRDPWAAPGLAGAGYRAGEPLAVRLARLVLLPASPEGHLVAEWLRQAAAAPEGAGRDRAAGLLRRAAGWYLARFPGEAGAVAVMLGPVAELLGVRGGFGAAALPGAPPERELAGRWAEAAGRYEAAYGAVREVAPGVALPPGAVRALVGELAGLAGGGEVAEYPEVLGDPELPAAAGRHRPKLARWWRC